MKGLYFLHNLYIPVNVAFVYILSPCVKKDNNLPYIQSPLCKGIPLLREMPQRGKGFAAFARKGEPLAVEGLSAGSCGLGMF